LIRSRLKFPGNRALMSAWAVMAALACQPAIAQQTRAQTVDAPPAAEGRGAGRGGGRQAPPGKALFTTNCAGCHGTDLSGGRAPSLFNQNLLEERTDEALHRKIESGNTEAGMPPFKGVLSDEQMWQLIAYARYEAGNMKAQPPFIASPDGQIVHSKKQNFRIDVVAGGLDTPWGLAFLPDGRLLVTERSGHLRVVADGKLLPEPVKGTPQVWVRQDSGLLDIALHPDYAKNGWIYLTYTEIQAGAVVPPPPANPQERAASPPSMTVVVRGRIDKNNDWVDTQEIFRAPAAVYTSSVIHYGSRLLFDHAGHLFYSLGERGEMKNAQDLSTPLGKVHRVNDDGTIPVDNPFVATPGAVPSIWTYGHRNPQGLSLDPVTGLLWESEHGPTGGDEINILEKGNNYGWGVVSMGIQPGIELHSAPGMVPPVVYYTPTIAPSGIHFYAGNRYPKWKNNLFVAGLAGQQLRRLEIKGRKVVAQEVLFQKYGRVRAVTTGPDGLLYVLLQNPTGGNTGVGLSAATPGALIRLAPLK
jgi:glucose/arabinose dehydrogenase